MNYDLSRIDYTICGISFPNTMKILPALSPKIQQKLAIGDKNGVLHCLAIKDEEPVVQFKTLPGKPITSVQLANASGAQADKIFAASGNEVKAYTRKGKVFLAIETSLSETITSMCVSGGDLILGSGRMVTHYRDLQEYHTYTCDDRVLDIAAFVAPNSTRLRLLVMVANKGAVILESGQVALQVTISFGPSRLAVPPWLYNGEIGAYFGAADGSIGIISLEGSDLISKSLVDGRSLGAVKCVGWFFMNGGAHLVIGRHDGSIQLYMVDMENIGDVPRLKYTYFCGEPVTSVGGGCVGTEEGELVATTFSGRVFALRSRRVIAGGMSLGNIPQDALAARRSKLEAEIARLEKQAASERDKYQRSTRAPHAGLSTPPLLDIQCELAGAKHDGWQEIRVTSVVPLDMLFLYCDLKLELQTDSAAVLSVCPSQGHAADLLATVRCQAGTKRLWIKARNFPDQTFTNAHSTKLLVYTLPAGAPRVARLMTLLLPALPYYSQHEDPNTAEDGQRLWCELRVSGSFSVAEVTSWLTIALPGELPRPATSIAFARSHTLLQTVLICRYQRGLASFKCDNISTIVVIKDIITNSSVEKSIRVDISQDIPENCFVKAFENIEDFFKKEHNKYQDIVLLKALSSLDLDTNIDEEGSPFLCEDYLRVCKGSTEEMESCFEELVETVANWYVDWCKLALRTVDQISEKTKLKEALTTCNLAEIKNILSENPVS